VIAAAGMGFCYGRTAIVENMNFSIARGEIVGLLGPNGAGKTTCLRLLAGYLPATTGKAMLGGAVISPANTKLRQRIGYVAEQAPLYGALTVYEHVQLALECHTLPLQTLAELLAQFELRDVAQHPVQALSKGYRRRVALAMAFASKPDVLLLDEPGDGLDPNQKQRLAKILHQAAAQAAILLSTHHLDDAERFCSRVLLINTGRLQFDGTPAALRARASDGQLATAFATLTGEAA
jgi:ABC-2 type transport system ATP-binding protein